MQTLSGLQEFVAVVDAGTFTSAARRLNVSVSHVSRQVADLEQRLGVQLLARSTRRMALTDHGRRLHEAARPLLEDLLRAQDDLARTRGVIEGVIRISMAGKFAEEHLIPQVADFCKLHPGVRVHIDVSPRNIDLLGEGFDLAVRMGPLDDSTSLTATRLASVPMVLVASPMFLSEVGAIAYPRDLRPAWCLSLADRPWTFTKGKAHASVKPAGRVSSNSGVAALRAAMAGLGVALVPAYYLQDQLHEGELVHLLPGWRPAESSTFHLVYPTGKYLPERVRQLIDHLRGSVSGATPP